MKPIRQFFLEANPNPERQGCPDEKTLKDIAENRLPADHPARLHLASCSPCFAEFRSFKVQFDDARSLRREFSCGLLAACLLLALGIYGSSSLLKKSEPNVVKGGTPKPAGELAAVDRTIDLFNHGTVRGGSEPNPLDAVSLPSTLVHLRLILPRFSDPGIMSWRCRRTRLVRLLSRAETENSCRWSAVVPGRSARSSRRIGWIILPGHCARE